MQVDKKEKASSEKDEAFQAEQERLKALIINSPAGGTNLSRRASMNRAEKVQ